MKRLERLICGTSNADHSHPRPRVKKRFCNSQHWAKLKKAIDKGHLTPHKSLLVCYESILSSHLPAYFNGIAHTKQQLWIYLWSDYLELKSCTQDIVYAARKWKTCVFDVISKHAYLRSIALVSGFQFH